MSQFTHVKKWFEEVYKTIGKFRLSQIQTTVLAALPKKALKKMLESRPEDALVKLVKLVNLVKLVKPWRLY